MNGRSICAPHLSWLDGRPATTNPDSRHQALSYNLIALLAISPFLLVIVSILLYA